MPAMDDINELLNEVKAAAARRAAIEREAAMLEARAQGEAPLVAEPEPVQRSSAEGPLTVERRQGQWRCYLAGERIRSGESLEVYVNSDIGWVRGKLLWGRRPTSPPTVRVDATDPHRIDPDGRPAPMGEFELLLPEDAVCRWPEAS
jgi:hypothetical protein